ncbi:MAG TPA: HAD-IA family hydrolase [bacterium]|nr:HAD-IA family hydrolase [bacterium]
MSDFRAIVYDLDGTLVDTFQDISEAANHALVTCGRKPLSLETWKRLVGYGVKHLYGCALAGGLDENGNLLGPKPTDEEIEKAIQATKEYYDKYPIVHSKPYLGVEEVLEAFHREGLKQAILSNKMHAVTDLTVNRLGLARWIDPVIGESSRFPTKPDPTALKYLMQTWKVTPQQTLMVGDAETDLNTAKNAGVRVCLLTYGARSREQLQALEPDWLIDDFRSLRGIVLGCPPSQKTAEAL